MKRAIRFLQCLAIVVLPLTAQAQFEYQHAFLWTQTGGMQDLGTISGSQNSIAYGINQLGEVVGEDNIAGSNETPFRWTSKAGMQGLPAFGAINSGAAAVNNSGEIIGDYYPDGDSSPMSLHLDAHRRIAGPRHPWWRYGCRGSNQ